MKKWYGSTKCDLCGQECGNSLYDGVTLLGGIWAVMCDECFIKYGVGLGTGKGQEYFKNEKGEYEKING